MEREFFKKMSRLINRPIDVIDFEGDTPAVFIDRGEHIAVIQLLDRWQESADWWNGEGYRNMFRVLTENNAILDLQCAMDPGKDPEWNIYKVWD